MTWKIKRAVRVVALSVITIAIAVGYGRWDRTCAMPLRLSVTPVAASELQVMQIGVDYGCLRSQVKGDSILVSVQATKITCDKATENCKPYEKTVRVSLATLQKDRRTARLPFDLTELKKSLNTDWKNVLVAVSLCEDKNHSGKCEDAQPLAQALRLSGRYLEAVDFGGVLAFELLANRTPSSSCPHG